MKMVKKLRFVIIVAMIVIPGVLLAQPGFDDDDDVDDVPFDGGVSLLVAAGVGYGLKKVYDRKKEDKEKQVLDS